MAFSTDIGIDLGTASILVYVRGKGVVLNEPAVVAIEQQRQKVLAVGTTAQKMLGRTPENIVALRPLREGVIADFDIAEIMLKHCLARAMERRRFLRPPGGGLYPRGGYFGGKEGGCGGNCPHRSPGNLFDRRAPGGGVGRGSKYF